MFSAKNKPSPCISLQIDGEALAEVNKSKFLGVIIDKLSGKDQISFVWRKVARGIGVLIKVRKVLHSESMKCLYYSFIYPYMIYCNQVWGSACKTNIEPLLILQKRVMRIILGVHPRSPSEPLFITLKFLSCENIFIYLIGRLMYRIYIKCTSLSFYKKIVIYMYTIPVRSAIIICHCVELTCGNVVWDMLALLFGTAFLVLISIQTSVRLFSLEVLKQQYVTTHFTWSHVLHVLLMYNYW